MKFVKMERVGGSLAERAMWFCEFTFKWVATTVRSEARLHDQLCVAHLGTETGDLDVDSAHEPIAIALEPIHPMDLQSLRCRRHPLTYQSKYAEWHLAAIRKLEARKFE